MTGICRRHLRKRKSWSRLCRKRHIIASVSLSACSFARRPWRGQRTAINAYMSAVHLRTDVARAAASVGRPYWLIGEEMTAHQDALNALRDSEAQDIDALLSQLGISPDDAPSRAIVKSFRDTIIYIASHLDAPVDACRAATSPLDRVRLFDPQSIVGLLASGHT